MRRLFPRHSFPFGLPAIEQIELPARGELAHLVQPLCERDRRVRLQLLQAKLVIDDARRAVIVAANNASRNVNFFIHIYSCRGGENRG